MQISTARQVRGDRVSRGSNPFERIFWGSGGNMKAVYEYFAANNVQMGANASLPRETWEEINNAIMLEERQSLMGVTDVMAVAGGTRNVGINIIVFIDPIQSDLAPANQALDPMIEPQFDDLDFRELGLPVPFLYKDTRINMRTLANVLPGGGRLDTSWASEATYQINLLKENNLFNGGPASIAAADTLGNLHPLFGYTTAVRHQFTPTAAWTTLGIVGNDVNAALDLLRDDLFVGPYMMYVSGTVDTILNQQRQAQAGQSNQATWRQSLLDDPRISDIKHTFQLAPGEFVIVKLQSSVVQIIDGAPTQTNDWEPMGIFGTDYRSWAIQAPFIKRTHAGRRGLVHGSGVTAA